MKKIFDGDGMVKTIMGAKKVKSGCVYRWSCFAVPYTHNDRQYIFNNFSKVCYGVEPDELDLRTEARFTSEQVAADENLSALVSDLFFGSRGRGRSRVLRKIRRYVPRHAHKQKRLFIIYDLAYDRLQRQMLLLL